jgi:hypothetical protein
MERGATPSSLHSYQPPLQPKDVEERETYRGWTTQDKLRRLLDRGGRRAAVGDLSIDRQSSRFLALHN